MARNALLMSASFLVLTLPVQAQQQAPQMESVTVTAERLQAARNGIQTQTGASTYTITAQDIENQPGGNNVGLNQVVLQAPGASQDSFGQLHVRGEHNGLQYRLNGIILPEGISAFGQTLNPRLAQSVRLIDGALPAEYGNRTAGIVDIQTRTGLFQDGGEISLYGGSHSTLTPSFDYGGSVGSFNYFLSGDYTTNALGIESPDGSADPAHDRSKQYHLFAFGEQILDQSSSVTAIAGASSTMFQIPNQRGLQPGGVSSVVGLGPLDPDTGNNRLLANGISSFPSENLDERQRELTQYAIVSYLRQQGNVDAQVSFFGRFSSLYYTPGANLGGLLYNGNAQTAYKRDVAYGLQAEAAWHAGDNHTARFGLLMQADDILSRTSSLVLATAPGGPGTPNTNPACDATTVCQTSATPLTIADNGSKHAWSYGLYAQDEWKLMSTLTLNYGLRYDQFGAFGHEDQLSPRANLVWEPREGTAIHAGFARYFSPPPIELVAAANVARFDNTTAAANSHVDGTPIAERADYYDAGVVQTIFEGAEVGIDTFYKASRGLLDEGQFGAPIILTPFNYQSGRQYGGEVTFNYHAGDFSAYVNGGYQRAVGRNIISSQFQFDPGDLAYIATHYIPLDHQQIGTVSAGASYKWGALLLSSDILYGTGLRKDGATPNGDHVGAYTSVNLSAAYDFSLGAIKGMTARLDIINAFDEVYRIRDGSGIGVGAPQFGARRGFFVGLSKAF